jgi:hypothetical protein
MKEQSCTVHSVNVIQQNSIHTHTYIYEYILRFNILFFCCDRKLEIAEEWLGKRPLLSALDLLIYFLLFNDIKSLHIYFKYLSAQVWHKCVVWCHSSCKNLWEYMLHYFAFMYTIFVKFGVGSSTIFQPHWCYINAFRKLWTKVLFSLKALKLSTCWCRYNTYLANEVDMEVACFIVCLKHVWECIIIR